MPRFLKIPRLFLYILLSCSSFQAAGMERQFELNDSLPELFSDRSILHTRLTAPFKRLRSETNDSVSIRSQLSFLSGQKQWDSIPVDLKARGNFRLDECYFPPMKLEFLDNGESFPVLFGQVDKIKLVLPCQKSFPSDDYVLKEYLAYRMYELLSPYHLKTRLTRMTLLDRKPKRTERYEVLGILLEHNKEMADRYQARIFEQKVHPMQVDSISAIRNAFFQFMIANTDYSLRMNHNRNILFLNGEFIVVPYDFDMSGFVNAGYSTVSNADHLKIIPKVVTERSYKGYQRDPALLEIVRKEFLLQEDAIRALILEHEAQFQSKSQFEEARGFIEGFFRILKDEREYEKYFIRLARSN